MMIHQPMIQQMNIADQTTCPLPTGAVVLQISLQRHGLSLLQVAMASGIRYLTAWKVAQGQPVRPEDATLLRAGLVRLTSHPSPAPMAVIADRHTARDGRKERNGN